MSPLPTISLLPGIFSVGTGAIIPASGFGFRMLLYSGAEVGKTTLGGVTTGTGGVTTGTGGVITGTGGTTNGTGGTASGRVVGARVGTSMPTPGEVGVNVSYDGTHGETGIAGIMTGTGGINMGTGGVTSIAEGVAAGGRVVGTRVGTLMTAPDEVGVNVSYDGTHGET